MHHSLVSHWTVISATALSLLATVPLRTPTIESFDVGKFRITSKQEFGGFPYPAWYRSVTLDWRSPVTTLSYRIEDDGTRVWGFASVSSGKNTCAVGLDDALLKRPAPNLFSSTLFLHSCGNSLTDQERRRAERYIRSAEPGFPLAFRAFEKAVAKLHGSSRRRCIRFEYGPHDRSCVEFTPDN